MRSLLSQTNLNNTYNPVEDFLYQREKTLNGIVQKFIEPKGHKNCKLQM